MLAYGKLARGMAPASARTHVQGAFGTERAAPTWQETRNAQRKRVEAFERKAASARPQPASDVLVNVYAQALNVANAHRAKALASQGEQRTLNNFLADAILMAIAQKAYSGEPTSE